MGWEFVFQNGRLPDHLNDTHRPFKPFDVGEPQCLIQLEMHRLRRPWSMATFDAYRYMRSRSSRIGFSRPVKPGK